MVPRGSSGKKIYQSQDNREYESFLPDNLPPKPELRWSSELVTSLSSAVESVARLDGAARLLPDLDLFFYSYVRKEAVLSSQIEGTQSSLSDLLAYESDVNPGVPIDDVTEVSCYVKALEFGMKKIKKGEDISLNFLLGLHQVLLSSGRGKNKDPGKLRQSQNWIGGKSPNRAVFVPPPHNTIEPYLTDLINFWKTSKEHTLVKAALIHSQFETIHPFRDGNGRIGRLLITLLLCQERLISQPLVYLSLYLKENREEYYEKLQAVRTDCQWEEWLVFFLQGVDEVTKSAFTLTQKTQSLFEKHVELIQSKGGRKAGGMLQLYSAIQRSPIFTIPKAEKILKATISKPTLYKAVSELIKLDIVKEIQINKSGTQVYAYSGYIRLLNE